MGRLRGTAAVASTRATRRCLVYGFCISTELSDEQFVPVHPPLRRCSVVTRDFAFTFKSADVGGAEVLVGSSMALLRQLEELNARTWRVSPEELQQWRRNGADYGVPLESGARFAFSVFFELTQEATRHRLPTRMDW